MHLLPPAPAALVDTRGRPAFGMYQGRIPHLDWMALQPAPGLSDRLLRHKRWQYAAIASPDCFIGIAIIDIGWAGSAFAYLFDRENGRMLASRNATGLPGLNARLAAEPFGNARFHGLDGTRIRFRRADGQLHLSVRAGRFAADAVLTLAEPVFAGIAPANWRAHSTHKSGALAVEGHARCGARQFDLACAHASLDSSDGLLARDTRWFWASAHAPGLGFNLQQGYMGEAENVLWLDGSLYRTGPARFRHDPADPMAPWQITTDDGHADLVFTPEGCRAHAQNLGIAMSRYQQPVGRFDGTLRNPDSGRPHPVAGLVGVTENHHARW